MKMVKYLISLVMLLSAMACDSTFEEPKYYEDLDNIFNTTWYRNIVSDSVYYYDITFKDTLALGEKDWYEGTMICYDSEKRDNEVVSLSQNFIYNFTAGKNGNRAVVKTKFDDGNCYDGFLIPKGHLKINDRDVFIIQLYSVDADGKPMLNDEGEYQSSILMWKE